MATEGMTDLEWAYSYNEFWNEIYIRPTFMKEMSNES